MNWNYNSFAENVNLARSRPPDFRLTPDRTFRQPDKSANATITLPAVRVPCMIKQWDKSFYDPKRKKPLRCPVCNGKDRGCVACDGKGVIDAEKLTDEYLERWTDFDLKDFQEFSELD
jgi:hypothetical protein